ncbi:hypothetical protein BDV93DRAFT_558837, partial [Ceratobasidium sp. AG-I]
MSKQPSKAVKPPATLGANTRSSSRIGQNPTSPVNRAASLEPPAPISVPRTIDAARKFLHGQGYISKVSEAVTIDVLCNQLAVIIGHAGLPPIVVAQLWSVKLLLPTAMKLASDHTKALAALTEQVVVLAERIPTPGEPTDYTEQFSSIEEKLASLQECMTVSLSNTGAAENAALETQQQIRTMREEVWETVPTRNHAPGPTPDMTPGAPPPNAPRRNPPPSNQKAPSAKQQAATDKRLLSQGCTVLVEPTAGLLFDGPKPLTARDLVQKANLAIVAAWSSLSKTDFSTVTGIDKQPRIVFRTAVRLPKGGIKYELENREQAGFLSMARVARAFEEGFGDVTCRGQGATVLLQ